MRRPVSILICMTLASIVWPAAAEGPSPGGSVLIAQSDLTVRATETPKIVKEQNVVPRKERIVYRPPRRGSPVRRSGGGVRGGSQAPPSPLALAPTHVAHTIRSAPTLYWYIDGATPEGMRIFFTMTAPREPDPLAEIELTPPASGGIQPLDLAAHGVTLEQDVSYQWFVAVVPDMDRRDQDLISSGYIRRVDDPTVSASSNPTAELYAERGLWYDALESVSQEIAANPGDSDLVSQRNSLLEQGDLLRAAE